MRRLAAALQLILLGAFLFVAPVEVWTTVGTIVGSVHLQTGKCTKGKLQVAP